MIPAIYKVRKRGQFVNDACQYILEHRKATLSICVKPMLILAVLEILNLIYMQSIGITILMVLVAVLASFVLPSIFMYVTEHPGEFDYPNRTPRIMEVRSLFMPYVLKTIFILVLGGIASFLGSFVVVGSLLFPYITLLAIVKYHRKNEYVSMVDNKVYTEDSLSLMGLFNMIFDSFGNFMLFILGSYIITFSMAAGPALVILMSYNYIIEFISPEFKMFLNSCMGEDTMLQVYFMLLMTGYIFGNMTTIIIAHFYYGHCQAKLNE